MYDQNDGRLGPQNTPAEKERTKTSVFLDCVTQYLVDRYETNNSKPFKIPEAKKI